MSLENLRRRAGLSQEAVSRHLGVSRATVVNWEQGRTEPVISVGVKLAELLGVSLEQLAEALKQ